MIVIALSGAGLWALHAMDARADPPPHGRQLRPARKGRASVRGEARLSRGAHIAPEPSQEDAWRRFRGRDAIASAGEADRACAEEPPRSALGSMRASACKRMERHAAAMQAMFGAMANAYVAIAPNLTAAQRDILSRNIVPLPAIPRSFSAALPMGPGFSSHRWRPGS